MLNLLRNIRKIPKYFMISMVVLLIASCGNPGDEDSLPVGANVDISPAGKTFTLTSVAPPTCNVAGPVNTSFHTVSVKNSKNQTLLNVPVSLSMDFTAANFTGFIPLELFVDQNQNGNPEPSELVSVNSGAYFTDTSKDNGTVLIIVKMNLSCWYGGALTVQAGAVSGSAQFEVVE